MGAALGMQRQQDAEDAERMADPAFWQGVWDKLLGAGKVTVPAMPKLTKQQKRSIKKFGFVHVYVPPITENDYPRHFVKLEWFYDHQDEHKPLEGKWVVVQKIAKPHPLPPVSHDAETDASKGWDRRLDKLKRSILTEISKTAGLISKDARRPTAEEWNLIGNLFNWLRKRRAMDLPNFFTPRTWEWCENTCGGPGGLLHVGSRDCIAPSGVHYFILADPHEFIGLRALAVL